MKKTLQHFTRATLLAAALLAAIPQTAALAQTSTGGLFKVDFTDNDINYYDPRGNNICSSGSTLGSVTITGQNPQDAFNYFVQQLSTMPDISPDLVKIYAAAIVGNFYEESGGVNPLSNQNGGGPGRGIAQWSVDQRWLGVIKLAQQQHKSEWDLDVQLQYAWQELSGNYNGSLTDLKKQKDLPSATVSFRTYFEQAGTPHDDVRLQDAQKILDMYGGGVAVTGSANGTNCATGQVVCNGPNATAGQQGLSAVRQNVVCLAKQEYGLWKSGALKPADGYFKYSQNNVELWCADFVSWIYDQAKYPLRPDPGWRVAAVATVQSIGMNSSNFHWHPAAGYTPRPGDIVIHLQNGTSHTNIVVGVNENGAPLTMIGGDQGSGPYPGGSSVTEYTASGFSGTDDITGYVSPD